MFLRFKKILNSIPTQLDDVIIKVDSIFLYNQDDLENRKTKTMYTATRVEVSSFPNYSFYTPSTPLQISNHVKVVDITGGVGSGTSCAGNPGVLDTIYAKTFYPMIKANMIMNNVKTELQEFIFNPEYIVFAEKIVFRDQRTSNQEEGTLLVLRDSQPKRIITNIDFDDLAAILEPISIPV